MKILSERIRQNYVTKFLLNSNIESLLIYKKSDRYLLLNFILLFKVNFWLQKSTFLCLFNVLLSYVKPHLCLSSSLWGLDDVKSVLMNEVWLIDRPSGLLLLIYRALFLILFIHKRASHDDDRKSYILLDFIDCLDGCWWCFVTQ